jgi:hypothetical protein
MIPRRSISTSEAITRRKRTQRSNLMLFPIPTIPSRKFLRRKPSKNLGRTIAALFLVQHKIRAQQVRRRKHTA